MQKVNLEIWNKNSQFKQIVSQIKDKQKITSTGIVSNAKASFLSALAEHFEKQPVIYLSSTSNSTQFHKFFHQLERTTEIKTKNIPSSTVNTLRGMAENNTHYIRLGNILFDFINNNAGLYMTNPESLLQFCPLKKQFQKLELKAKEEINLTRLQEQFINFGYQRVENVFECGQYAIRGETIDIFPSNTYDQSLAIRLNLFGDEIEKIRMFEPWTQRSINRDLTEIVPICSLYPFPTKLKELQEQLEKLTEQINEQEREFWLNDLVKFEEEGWQRFLPWIIDEYCSWLDYLSEDCILIVEEFEFIMQQLSNIVDKKNEELKHMIDKEYIPTTEVEKIKKLLSYKNLTGLFENLQNKNMAIIELKI